LNPSPFEQLARASIRKPDVEVGIIARLIARLPELVEFERDRNRARSRRKPQLLRIKPVTIGDLIREGRLL
jgi:hypothetical protein